MSDESSEILRVVGDGELSAADIQSGVSFDVDMRALGYRLRKLVEDGALHKRGIGRGTTYTKASAPVGYDRKRAEGYKPNESSFLSKVQLTTLHEMGETGITEAPAGTYARQILERFLIDLSWASSSLEGNTYSLLDTTNLVTRGEAADGKDRTETAMVLNHKAAIEFLVDGADDHDFDRRTVLNLHALLMDDLVADTRQLGAVRQIPVGISGSRYTPLANPHVLGEMLDLMLAIARRIHDPFEAGVFVFLHLSYLQPFVDGNKRTARLLLNLRLIQANLKPFTFVDADREEYAKSTLTWYERGAPNPLIDLLLKTYRDSVARYSIVFESIEPDPFKLKNRAAIQAAVKELVLQGVHFGESEADALANQQFDDPADQVRFAAAVVSELQGLHEGNFARFKIRPSEFERWVASKTV